MLGFWQSWLFLLVAVYCGVQAVRDFRSRSYVMGAIGAACLLALVLSPLPSRAIKLDLPRAGSTP
jgi:hypothetical protein